MNYWFIQIFKNITPMIKLFYSKITDANTFLFFFFIIFITYPYKYLFYHNVIKAQWQRSPSKQRRNRKKKWKIKIKLFCINVFILSLYYSYKYYWTDSKQDTCTRLYTVFCENTENKFSNLKDFSDHMSLKISTEKMLSLTNYIEFNPKHFGYTI